MNINIGDIYYAQLLDQGSRPVIILQKASDGKGTYAVPMFANNRSTNNKYSIIVKDFILGRDIDVSIRCDKLLIISNDQLYEKVGSINERILNDINIKISDFLNENPTLLKDDKKPKINLNNPEEFYKVIINLNELAINYKKDNSKKAIWKERLINGFIGFVFGIITSLIFWQF